MTQVTFNCILENLTVPNNRGLDIDRDIREEDFEIWLTGVKKVAKKPVRKYKKEKIR